jgi:hypothetical protein
MVDLAVEQFRKMDVDREFCSATGGHEPMDEDPNCAANAGRGGLQQRIGPSGPGGRVEHLADPQLRRLRVGSR